MKALLLLLSLVPIFAGCSNASESAFAQQPAAPLLLAAPSGEQEALALDGNGATAWRPDAPWGLGAYLRMAWEQPAHIQAMVIASPQQLSFDVYANGHYLGAVRANDTLKVAKEVTELTCYVANSKQLPLVWATENANKPGIAFFSNEKKTVEISEISLFDAANRPIPMVLPKTATAMPTATGNWVNVPIFYTEGKNANFFLLRTDYTFCYYKTSEAQAVWAEGHWQSLGNGRFLLEGKHTQAAKLAEAREYWQEKQPFSEEIAFSQGKLLRGNVVAPLLTAIPDSAFVDLATLSDFIIDVKYATKDNFVGEPLYDCGRCLLRYGAAQALLKAHEQAKALGYRIKVFDGYRPLHIQKRLWEAFPNPTYVANPYSGIGSIHNRGAAVDMTLALPNGEELNMGTPYDFFGREAHQDYYNLPEDVLANRQLLRKMMENAGFLAIRTEWWHYSYHVRFTISDVPVPCQ